VATQTDRQTDSRYLQNKRFLITRCKEPGHRISQNLANSLIADISSQTDRQADGRTDGRTYSQHKSFSTSLRTRKKLICAQKQCHFYQGLSVSLNISHHTAQHNVSQHCSAVQSANTQYLLLYIQTNTKEQSTKEAQRENRKRDAMGNSVIEIGMPDT